MKESLKMIRLMEKENIGSMMEKFIKECLEIIKCGTGAIDGTGAINPIFKDYLAQTLNLE